ncbi:hypothetical protein NE237_020978 [Protea cynaroides]|uniref:Cellulose synthase-like protein G3 n=1 Tax=Protea cynaroides TaxID=273540 RepID=A0A9Q0K4F3_9MAGN|nr:hypothetical protein NE237_020978 [Protea cynaroides]
MKDVTEEKAAAGRCTRLHTTQLLRRTPLNRAFALVYASALVALVYRHIHHNNSSSSSSSSSSSNSFLFLPYLMMMVADAMFAFMRATTDSLRLYPVRHQEFPEKLDYNHHDQYPGVDVFICTADPYKEPPMGVVNTALSVLGYEYPPEKLTVYLSDDGGSELTLFAFMEAAKFAHHWLSFCRDFGLLDRCPDAYFGTGTTHTSREAHNMKIMYEEMKVKVDRVMKRGSLSPEEPEHDAFNKLTAGSTLDHPAVIQLRVSATMSNAPVVMNLDCDTISNDPKTLLRVLCYLADPVVGPKLAYVQFPQRFHGIDKNDIYGNDHRRLYQIDPLGMDDLAGTRYIGSGCFFQRRSFFGGPSDIPKLNSHRDSDKSFISSKTVLDSAHHVASCKHEHGTNWGIEIGFRYGSLAEDYKTSYMQQCKGWNAVFCHPKRAAFLGGSPFTLNDVLNQNIRWAIGLLEVAVSKYSPITYGTRAMGLLMGLAYAHNGFEGTWCLPITTYAYIPQLALLSGVSLFPKVSDPWFYLYAFLFLGAYIQDCLEFILAGGTIRKWWNDQRMWMIRGNSSYLFGCVTFLLNLLGFAASGFNVTSKVVIGEQRKRYDQGIFEFGVPSPMFVPLTATAILNLIAFVVGLGGVLRDRNAGEMFVQLFISGFVMVNCWPIYEAIALRKDAGKMPAKITIISFLLVCLLYLASSLALKL